MSELPTLRSLFQSTPISTLRESPKFTRHIVSIKSKETFYDALYLMNRYNILSLCCMEEKKIAESDETESTILGFLSNLDILFYISEVLLLFEFEGLSPESITLRQCLSRSVRDMMYQKLETEHYHTVKETLTLFDLITTKFARGVHRSIIMRDEQSRNFDGAQLVGMITQSDIIKFAVDSEWQDEGFDALHFIEESWKNREVISLYEDNTLAEALQQMSTHSVSAVAIVKRAETIVDGNIPRNHDDSTEHQSETGLFNGGRSSFDSSNKVSGKMIGNFSASDLRRIIRDFSEDHSNGALSLSQYFNMTIIDYLTKYSKHSLNPITIHSGDKTLTMRTLIDLFANCKIHRVWIVDDENIPTGVLTLTDLSQFITRQK